MKQKKNLLTNNMKRFKTKNLDRVNEHILGELPSQKLMKMKWNPLTEAMNIDVLQKDISELLPKYDDWNVQDGGIVKSGYAEGAHDLLVYRGDTLMGTVRNPMQSTGERADDLLLLFFTKDWDTVRGAAGQYSGTRSEILNTIKTKEFGTAQPLPADLATDDDIASKTSDTPGGQDTTDKTPVGSIRPDGTSADTLPLTLRSDGSEIYDQEPSGGFCKRNLDLDWYNKNIITGRSYLRLGDCGIAVETAQDSLNDLDPKKDPIQVDGMYGPKTKKRTKLAQDLLSIKVDGLFGQKTHEAIIKAIKSASTKIEPIGPDADISTSLRQAAPITNADNQEFKKKAEKNKEKRKANRIKRIKNRQGRLQKKMDKLVRKANRIKR